MSSFLKTLLAMAICSSILWSTPLYALQNDNEQPLTFSAAHVLYHNKAEEAVLIGNVKIQQGSTHLTGDQVTFYSKQGKIEKMVAIGQLAHYSTLPQNQKPIDIFGKTIEYYPRTKKAVIIGDASYAQGQTHFSGSYMVYDLAHKSVTSIPKETGKRTVLILQPQELPQGETHANPTS